MDPTRQQVMAEGVGSPLAIGEIWDEFLSPYSRLWLSLDIVDVWGVNQWAGALSICLCLSNKKQMISVMSWSISTCLAPSLANLRYVHSSGASSYNVKLTGMLNNH